MKILHNPPVAAVKEILASVQLPTADIAPAHMENFLGAWLGKNLVGVVGVEPYGRESLLRSLAVLPANRGSGVGAKLLLHAEQRAYRHGTRALFLLTTTAAPYFGRHGYALVARELAPEAIRLTKEFTSLCPSSAVVMAKILNRARGATPRAGSS